jgi:hypothetical protein
MKLLLSILLIGILIMVSGCVDTNKPKFDTIDANIKSLRQADSDNDAHINDLKKGMVNYASVESVNNLDTKLNDHIKAPLPDQASLIEAQQKQINELQKQIDILKTDLASYKTAVDNAIPQTPGDNQKLVVTVTKSVDSVSEILADSETDVDFTVKLVNKTTTKLDNIVITGYIVCNRSLDLVDDYPVMRDTTNGTLLFDYEFDGSDTVNFSFSHSTGSPTVYLSPNETFIFHPELVLRGADDSSRDYKFTLVITDFIVGE